MTLKRMVGDASLEEVKSVPMKKEYERLTSKLKAQQLEEVKDFVFQELEHESKFSVATKFPGSWEGTPLMHLYNATSGNEEVAAMFLGLLIIDVLVNHDERHWQYTKTNNLNNREFATNFYWLEQAFAKSA